MALNLIDSNDIKVTQTNNDINLNFVKSLVVNSLDGNETDVAPSVNAVNGLIIDSLDSNSTTNAPSINAVNKRFTYSTDEQVIGTWIDGKPLYRKTFSIGEITSSADTTVSTGILNCDTITQMSGNFKRKNFEYLRYGLDSNYLGEVHFNSNTGVFSIRSASSNIGFSSGVITIEYTKTTD